MCTLTFQSKDKQVKLVVDPYDLSVVSTTGIDLFNDTVAVNRLLHADIDLYRNLDAKQMKSFLKNIWDTTF